MDDRALLSAKAALAFSLREDISVRRVDSVWQTPPWDTSLVNQQARKAVEGKVDSLKKSPQGVVKCLPLIGPAGSGKTHLLSHLCQKTMERGGYFVLVNMSNMRSFWDTLILHFLFSLARPGQGGIPQGLSLARRLVEASGARAPSSLAVFFDSAEGKELSGLSKAVYSGLFKKGWIPLNPQATPDLVRSVIFLNSSDSNLSSMGYTWLQSGSLGDPDPEAADLGFKRSPQGRDEVVVGLTRLMSLGGGFTVIGMDQLDPLFSNSALGYQPAGEAEDESPERVALIDKAALARMVISELAGGLASLVNDAAATLAAVSVIADGWHKLMETASRPDRDRFEARPVLLETLALASDVRALISKRMEVILEGSGISSPYPTWPFPERSFEEMDDITARELLRRMDQHLERCVEKGEAFECESLAAAPSAPFAHRSSPDPLLEMEERFQSLKDAALSSGSPAISLADGLSALMRAFLQGWTSQGQAELVYGDDSRPAQKGSKYSYEYIRFFSDPDLPPDRSLSLWAIDHPHHRSFQFQIKSALVQSGADSKHPHRRLAVMRLLLIPGGQVTSQMAADFDKNASAFWLRPSDSDLAVMKALASLFEHSPEGLSAWLKRFRPAFDVACAAPHLAWLLGEEVSQAAFGALSEPPSAKTGGSSGAPLEPPLSEAEPAPEAPPKDEGSSSAQSGESEKREKSEKSREREKSGEREKRETREEPPSKSQSSPAPSPEPRDGGPKLLAIGRELGLYGEGYGPVVAIESRALAQHLALFGASGTGKTFLLKRLIEEAALSGVPSVVLDGSGDLCLLGQRWDSPPERWLPGDEERAEELFRRSETVIWTPGASKGNPLSFRIIPRFEGFENDEDETEFVIDDTASVLMRVVGAKGGAKSTQKIALLKASLRLLAERGGQSSIDELARILERPREALRGDFFDGAQKIAKGLVADLKAALVARPQLRQEDAVDVSRLLRSESGKTRISVVYLKNLGSLESIQQFVLQLVGRLFTHISRNPPKSGQLAGLLVIDEAKDLVPSDKKADSSEAIIRFANQARKYGFGLVLATQIFNSINHSVVSNCRTLVVGKQNSPASIKNANDILGAEDADTKSLANFGFYLKAPAAVSGSSVRRFEIVYSLSRHGSNPPNGQQIIEMASAQGR
ncbi:MAG: type IV secretion system DNA-binding domain-containing protein [Deltaproteobacteria bacterium]|jgi:DNA helicase HerA-like ATPase|nr:type IV secretion system DNA-binding domain-containing protein [Deltaproteobacteria bacterium]